MDSENFIEKLAAQFGQSASVKNVYGAPVQAGEKTIIPVAQIAYGYGGGYGQGKGNINQNESSSVSTSNVGQGAGGGGGMFARAKGVYEVTPTGTRFVPATGTRIFLTGLVIGFLIGTFLDRKQGK